MPTRASHRREREGRPWRLLALGGVVMAIGLVLPLAAARLPVAPDEPGPQTVRTRLADRAPTAPAFVVEPAVRFEQAPRPHPATGVPLALIIPKLGVHAPVTRIEATAGVLVPPSNPQTLGWWAAGAKPGALLGGALVTGHTVSTGGGAFDDLEALKAGDRVTVRTRSGRIRYAVRAVSVYRKASLARQAGKVFDQSVPGRLVLVTCEDWDGVRYLSNAVILADLVEG